MEYRNLGQSDISISRLAFGCMSLPLEYVAAEKIIHAAIDRGVNYFDTADLYQGGENEKMLGKALRPVRDKVVLATKVGNQMNADGKSWRWNPTKTYIVGEIEKSLRRLQTDYVDLYQLHGGTIEDAIDETIEAFEQLVTQGKIRYYGISSIRPNVIRQYINRSKIVSVMMQFSLLDRRASEACLPLLEQNNIGVLARGSLAGGLLAGKSATAYLGYTATEVEKAANAITKCSSGRTMSQTALLFSLQQPGISAVVAGIRTMEQLLDVCGIADAKPLNPEELQFLKTVIPPNKYEQHL